MITAEVDAGELVLNVWDEEGELLCEDGSGEAWYALGDADELREGACLTGSESGSRSGDYSPLRELFSMRFSEKTRIFGLELYKALWYNLKLN